ncbi:MAG: carbohydrate ABC transporter substrate-binding protein [Parasporobacterium sp.]|nr:carbohydrate ABC transporter substrate-binding protein [Parasporobacterium sp.]
MKKLLALILASAMVLTMLAVPAFAEEAEAPAEEIVMHEGVTAEGEGTVFNIYAWNEEFKGFFEKYYQVPEGVTVNWIIVPSDGGAYQNALDEALLNQENASADDKVDMFLAEADYILKYTGSELTQDVGALGVTDFSNAYEYTVQAASDANGVVKGVSFQCCPSALIYRRSIAKDVLGTDDPAEVQEALSDWDKFAAVADQAKEKGYYMTASFAATYRPFSNNASTPWVVDGALQIPAEVQQWIDLTDSMMEKEESLTSGIWEDECTAQMFAEGKTMCYFGPAWYFNFSMGNAQDPEKGCPGDWAICEGPMAHFWGGTWILAPAGTDNPTMVADVMNTFINDEAVCEELVVNEAQFSNNQAVNGKFAEDPAFGVEFLGGQNATAVFVEMAKNIKFENGTIYDQLCNEGLQNNLQDFYRGGSTKDEALANFYKYINESYPEVVTP